MHFKRYGEAQGPCSIIIGTWDPLILWDINLIKRFCRDAKARKQKACVVLISPSPREILSGQRKLTYDCEQSRIEMMREIGADAVLKVAMSKKDLDRSASYFMHRLRRLMPIVSLYLGARQSLGFQGLGSQKTVLALCQRMNIQVTIFRYSYQKHLQLTEFYKKMETASLEELQPLMRRAPTWFKPETDRIRINWPQGLYLVQAHGNGKVQPGIVRVKTVQGKHTYFNWPANKEIRKIVFNTVVNEY
ncbi:MAG: hypothetical protein P0Y53_01065 [Candidatus Pseudobacter hemicellulosilyticus]|uniref:FAD synthase n=1 Tax=Candidatus Pseudobacter hemicellulosilyticus TaxID=3121375 RepID=A0AAJ5WUV9_9BACT|nr:MAG: hypothetical protein P0Y53_01065 [Pseudobacter sp.]